MIFRESISLLTDTALVEGFGRGAGSKLSVGREGWCDVGEVAGIWPVDLDRGIEAWLGDDGLVLEAKESDRVLLVAERAVLEDTELPKEDRSCGVSCGPSELTEDVELAKEDFLR